MVTKHLTDEEIQLFAFDKANCGFSIVEHIHICAECKAKTETYQLLIKGISQPQPVFDFDLSALVLNQLPEQDFKPANDKLLTWVFIFICVRLIGTAFYFFRGYLDSMFKGIAVFSIYLLAISAVTVIAWVFVEMYKKFQKEMRVLDLY